MIQFDENGNPQPTGKIRITTPQFKKLFADSFPYSNTRQDIWRGYERYTADLLDIWSGTLIQWVGGSFASAVRDPIDIDLVTVIPYADGLEQKLYTLEQFSKKGGSRELYRVDASIMIAYSETDPLHIETTRQYEYWTRLYSLDRQDRPRAFFEIVAD
jgi:hypothetical protein